MKTIQIVSGGQTGVDRAALAWAVRHHVPYGGWCPSGRLSDDGSIPRRYHLRETPTPIYEERTLWNARDSDGTVIFTLRAGLSGSSAHAAMFCFDLQKPAIHLPAEIFSPGEAAYALRHFLKKHQIRKLNIAGPRASEEPGVERWVRTVLDRVFEL